MTMITGLAGVYDADGGLRGEAAYVLGHLLGRRECALCDLTHGPLRRKAEWDAMTAALPVPFTLAHRNEVAPALGALVAGALPCVVAETADTPRIVVDAASLAACGGEVEAFAETLEAAVAGAGLLWPGPRVR
ncbi:MAG: hypothetical protein R6T85_07705 [Egibacteraceae bacterium]